jgi:hypothetical protein
MTDWIREHSARRYLHLSRDTRERLRIEGSTEQFHFPSPLMRMEN